MKKWGTLIFCFLIIVSLVGCAKCIIGTSQHNNRPKLRIVTEEYPPLNFTKNGKLTGLSTDLAREILKRMNIHEKIEVLPWNQAYALALKEPNVVLFSTMLNAERKGVFKWVGPIARIDNAFYAKKGATSEFNNLEGFKQVGKIATVQEYAFEQSLRQEGFKNLVSNPTNEEALKRLLDGDVDILAAGNLAIPATLKKAGAAMDAIEKVYTVSTDLLYFAFSKEIPDMIVQEWQAELNALKKDGAFGEIYKKWLPNDIAPGILQLVTEDYPPITFMKDGKVTGLATEIVQEILKRQGIPDNIILTSWGNAYRMSLLNPNVLLFSTTRTAKREDLFKWLGPIGSYNDALYAKKGSGVKIITLDDARKVKSIGTVNGWFSEEFLKAKGFRNLESSPEPVENAKKLVEGKLDLCAFTDMTAPQILEKASYTIEDLEQVFIIKRYDFYIAFSLGTPDDTVHAWQKSFDEMKKDGTFEKIFERWIPGGATF